LGIGILLKLMNIENGWTGMRSTLSYDTISSTIRD